MARSGGRRSVIEALDSEQVQTIISTGIDAVLATGESLPVIEHLAALLIKFKSKAEELVATVADAKRKHHKHINSRAIAHTSEVGQQIMEAQALAEEAQRTWRSDE